MCCQSCGMVPRGGVGKLRAAVSPGYSQLSCSKLLQGIPRESVILEVGNSWACKLTDAGLRLSRCHAVCNQAPWHAGPAALEGF